ncbi:MAG: ATP-binding protein, partial [Gammaproteobacteria bacterium]
MKGKQAQPLRIVLHGTEGVGKTTFAASAPSPIFIGAEDGTSQLDVVRFQSPETWQEILDAVRELETAKHEYKTLVLDTVDWAEPMLWEHICKRDGFANVEAYGYGKGYQAALDEWRVFLGALERMRKARGMHIILVAHSWIKPFKNPEGEDFDRYELKLNPKASGKIKEWADAVLFANHETFATEDKKTKRIKGVSTGARLLYTQRTAAFDAKNRHSLPESLPLSWEEFEQAIA